MNDILGMKITVQEREVANYVQNLDFLHFIYSINPSII